MVAKEVREFRTASKKLVEVEEKSKMLLELRKKKVSLTEDELFVQNLNSKFKILGDKRGARDQHRSEIVSITLKYKIRDNNLHGVKVRKKRDYLYRKLESEMGKTSRDWKELMKDVKANSVKLRSKLRMKYKKKVEHLITKYGVMGAVKYEVDDNLLKYMGNPKIFVTDLEPEEVKKPVLVENVGENIEINDDEYELLKLGPKFCILVNLSDEGFEADLEETLMKVKWDLMGEENENKPGVDDVAMRVALGNEACDVIDNEIEEERQMLEAETRTPFMQNEMTFSLAKRRATDIKGNSRVYFPRKARALEEEAVFEAMRLELRGAFNNYVSRNCGKGGAQTINLSPSQARGLKSLKKRVKEGDLVIIPTDKSGNLAIMSRQSYLEAGLKHTLGDREVGWEVIKESQHELNGHVSMLIKVFKIGQHWDHGARIRESTMGESMSVCPLSLLFKDHKGWTSDSGTVPPTRPVVGGHMGINLHISEIVSDILDPVVANYKGGHEVISTEDMVARTELLNEKKSGWSKYSYWEGQFTTEYRACTDCHGDEGHVLGENNLEYCYCDDGIDGDGRIMVTTRCMKFLKRKIWEETIGWDSSDIDRKLDGTAVLLEDLQEQTEPMVIIGTDVINLYPSLDITMVVGEVEEAILKSGIKWQDIDYLEGARYIALNWSEQQCRTSKLARVLPRRRYTGGSRPGLRGAGPQGGARGDQEQWVFPHVRLSSAEKDLVVATVVQIATEAMFKHHFYGFGGKKFQQMGGGPIGLRGTCTLARLVMQIFDGRWMDRVMSTGLQIDLYTRYMDDGRLFCHPIKRGWRWLDGRMVYCLRWEAEDWDRSLLDVTVEAIKGSMAEVIKYLRFTFETGSDYDGWLPTLDTNLMIDSNNQVLYKYYEKPTTTNTTIRQATAMAENAKLQSLAQDLVRRLLNTKEELPPNYRAMVIDGYGVKLRSSGYSLEVTRKILTSGMKGYVSKVKRRRMVSGRRVHRTAMESSKDRLKKKMIGRNSWFKGGKRDEVKDGDHAKGAARPRTGGAKKNPWSKELRTRAVLFVEQTPRGELARLVREQLHKLEGIMGYKLRVVERTGRSIVTIFPQSTIWRGEQCGREECVTCYQGGEGLPDCTRRGVVYESICTECNPGAMKKGELGEMRQGAPSLYVGESSRSIQERAKEHWGAARRGDKDSHMVRHQAIVHKGEQPAFLFKVVSNPRTALSRQIMEAVRIRRRGGAGSILNSKAEFNRCHIPRLVVEEEDEEQRTKRLGEELKSNQDIEQLLSNMDTSWEQRKARERDQAAKKRRGSEAEGEQRVKRRRKMKYEVLRDDWGVVEDSGEDGIEVTGEQQCGMPVSTTVIVTSQPPPDKGRGKMKRYQEQRLNTPSIADYLQRSKRKRMDDTSSQWEDDQAVTDGYEEYLRSQGGDVKRSCLDGTKVNEDDISVKEDDLEEFLEDDSWELLAEQTQSIIEQEQSCLRDGVTSLPTLRMVEDNKGLPVSDGRSDSDVIPTTPSKEEEAGNHIGWATRILTQAFEAIAARQDGQFVEGGALGGDRSLSGDGEHVDTKEVTGKVILERILPDRDGDDEEGQDIRRLHEEATVSPSIGESATTATEATPPAPTIAGLKDDEKETGQGRYEDKEMTDSIELHHVLSGRGQDDDTRVETGMFVNNEKELPSMDQTGTTPNTDQQTFSTVENFTDTALSDMGGVVTSTPIRPEGKTHAEIPPCQGG